MKTMYSFRPVLRCRVSCVVTAQRRRFAPDDPAALPHLHNSDSGRTDQIGPSRPRPEPRTGRAPGSPEARETRRARVKPRST